MAEHIANSDVEGRKTAQVKAANMGTKESNTNEHILEADTAQLLKDLVSAGFDEAIDSVTEI
jgi:DNA-binding protein YbaB